MPANLGVFMIERISLLWQIQNIYMKSTEIYALIGRVLAGEADEQDHHSLQQWLAETEENRAVYKNLQQIWYETTLHDQFSNADSVYDKILEQRDNIKENGNRSFPLWNTAFWKRVGVAAVFLLMIGALSYLWLQIDSAPAVLSGNTALVVRENPAGQKSKIVLTDGTIVWLNSESKMSYPSDFNDTIRRIVLTGEAYFQVAKDADRPFVVVSGELQTTALGTAFNVRYYVGDSVATVFLVEGKVKIEDVKKPGSLVFLEPGWGVRSKVDGIDLHRFTDLAEKWTGWRDGILFFDNAGILEVVKACERWYSVEFSIKGTPPEGWQFTGKFKNEYLENVLESMRYGKDFDYSIQNKHVELIFKN